MTIKIAVLNYPDNNKDIEVLTYNNDVLVDTTEIEIGESHEFWLHSKQFIMVTEKEIV